MRLLNIHSYTFREFHGENIPPYLIASHRWRDHETTFKDVLKKRNMESQGWQKVEGFCERARQDNELLKSFENAICCEWIWIDTACIDKKSSAEVSESINSMFEWYSKAQECHAYLADVKPFPASQQLSEILDDFKNSEWFKRGWTLQELLAPRCVVFFTQTWQIIGHKCSDCSASQSCEGAGPLLNAIVSEVTGIPEEVLRDFERSKSLSVEEKMTWQVERRTTKIEDRAYCLLGLFDVHMPLLYGEGEKAMLRLERTVFEELERPWQSQLRLNFNEDKTKTGVLKRHSPLARSGRPLAIMRYSDVEGEVSCICGYNDDDGALVACDVCQYWQHIVCYFPRAGQQVLSESQEHRCVRCCPRELDAPAAIRHQKQKHFSFAGQINALKRNEDKIACLKRSGEENDDAAMDNSSVKRPRTAVGERSGEESTTAAELTADSTPPVADLNRQSTLSEDQPTEAISEGPAPIPTPAEPTGLSFHPNRSGSPIIGSAESQPLTTIAGQLRAVKQPNPAILHSSSIWQQRDLEDANWLPADLNAKTGDDWYRDMSLEIGSPDLLALDTYGWVAFETPDSFLQPLGHPREFESTTPNLSSMDSAWRLPSTTLPWSSAADQFPMGSFTGAHGQQNLGSFTSSPFFIAPWNAPSTGSSEQQMTRQPMSISRRDVRPGSTAPLHHEDERTEKCPVPACAYHVRGFARKSDLKKHLMSHYRGEMTCAFCDTETQRSITFSRTDILKRHLMRVHGVERLTPNSRQNSSTSAVKLSKASLGAPNIGQCSRCSRCFANPQDFHDHLDDCVMRSVRGRNETHSYTCPHDDCASAGVAFRFRKDLERHTRARHGGSEIERHSCPNCGWDFTRKNDLLRHQRVMHGMDVNRRMHGSVIGETSTKEGTLDT